MTADRQWLDISFIFDVLASEETAVTSLNLAALAGWTGAEAALGELGGSDAASIYGDMVTLMDNANLFWGNYSQLTAVKIAAIGTDGHYLAEPILYESETPDVGGSTTTIPQSTVVGSLRSGFTLGGANYGRMYLPHTRLGLVSGTAQSNAATTDIVAAAFKTFINDVTAVVNGEITAIVTPVIISQITGRPSKAVTSVAVGTVTDTQRRRRNRLTETSSFEPLA